METSCLLPRAEKVSQTGQCRQGRLDVEKLDLRPNKRIIRGLKRHEMAQVSVHWEEYRSNVQSSRESQDNVFCNASTF